MDGMDESGRYTQLLGGGIGGLGLSEVSGVVENLLGECGDREVEITVYPEVVGGYYSVEWRFVEFDRNSMSWEGLEDRGGDLR